MSLLSFQISQNADNGLGNLCPGQGEMNNYIVISYRDVIVVTNFATRRASKAQSIVMY